MADKQSKVTIHMVSSLDGFIAKADGDVSWLHSTDNYENGVTLTDDYITEFVDSIDCYVMGSKTYEHALELGWAYGDKPVYVLTSRNLNTVRENVEFCSGDLAGLIKNRVRKKHQNIWIAGGAMLTKELIRMELADEIIVSFIPIILGEGTLFFDYIGVEQKLHLKDVAAFKDGMVEITYEFGKTSR